ncbi:MAG TPA: hypothetical protein ENJ82_14095 [Bacteroidetes bacterium]|nr:hypothetical protein [Bacteroidota bacterium]
MNEISTLTEKVEKMVRTRNGLMWLILIAALITVFALILNFSQAEAASSETFPTIALLFAVLTTITCIISFVIGNKVKVARHQLAKAQDKISAFVVNFYRSNEFDNINVSIAGKEGEAGSQNLYLFQQAAVGKQPIKITGTWTVDGLIYEGTGTVNIVADRVGSLTISLLDEPDRVQSGDLDGSLTISLLEEPD